MKQSIIETIEVHKKLVEAFASNSTDHVIAAAEMITASVKAGGCVYLCGNGGSAADAQHVAGELVGRFLKERKAIAAVALNTDTAVLTAVGNDYGYDTVFKRQVEALVKSGDILWAFSTSGTSKNILAAVELAKEKGAKVIGFTGKKDTLLEKLSDVCISVDAPYSAPAQEVHQLAYHIICDLVEQSICTD